MGRRAGSAPSHTALIAAYGGDTVKAAIMFAERFHSEMNITVLVDFDNDSVTTALEVAEALGRNSGACAWTPPRTSSTAR